MNPISEPRTATLTINEIYHSIQGESTWAGLPCVFVRLTFCDLRCTYCDTAYAFYEGEKENVARDYDRSFEIRLSPRRNHRRGAAIAKKCPSLDDRAG